MKTKSIDLNIEAIFNLADRDYKYVGIRKTHQGGHLEGALLNLDSVSTEIDGDDYVRVMVEHIDDHLTWEEDGKEVLFYRSMIDEDKRLYAINPKFGYKVVQAILALRDNTSLDPIDDNHINIDADSNVIYIESDAFWDWENDFTLDDVERLIEKIAEEV